MKFIDRKVLAEEYRQKALNDYKHVTLNRNHSSGFKEYSTAIRNIGANPNPDVIDKIHKDYYQFGVNVTDIGSCIECEKEYDALMSIGMWKTNSHIRVCGNCAMQILEGLEPQ